MHEVYCSNSKGCVGVARDHAAGPEAWHGGGGGGGEGGAVAQPQPFQATPANGGGGEGGTSVLYSYSTPPLAPAACACSSATTFSRYSRENPACAPRHTAGGGEGEPPLHVPGHTAPRLNPPRAAPVGGSRSRPTPRVPAPPAIAAPLIQVIALGSPAPRVLRGFMQGKAGRRVSRGARCRRGPARR